MTDLFAVILLCIGGLIVTIIELVLKIKALGYVGTVMWAVVAIYLIDLASQNIANAGITVWAAGFIALMMSALSLFAPWAFPKKEILEQKTRDDADDFYDDLEEVRNSAARLRGVRR